MSAELYSNWFINSVVVITTMFVVGTCVLVHYEGLLFSTRKLSHLPTPPRFKVVLVIACVLCLHVIEIWLFGLSQWLLLRHVPDVGAISNDPHPHIFDVVYMSATTFSTVGYGDLAPRGPLRFLFGTEALTGFVMITWSASFTYLEMERHWKRD